MKSNLPLEYVQSWLLDTAEQMLPSLDYKILAIRRHHIG